MCRLGLRSGNPESERGHQGGPSPVCLRPRGEGKSGRRGPARGLPPWPSAPAEKWQEGVDMGCSAAPPARAPHPAATVLRASVTCPGRHSRPAPLVPFSTATEARLSPLAGQPHSRLSKPLHPRGPALLTAWLDTRPGELHAGHPRPPCAHLPVVPPAPGRSPLGPLLPSPGLTPGDLRVRVHARTLPSPRQWLGAGRSWDAR